MPDDPRGWLPFRLLHSGGRLDCRWLHVGTERFTEPFFEETLGRCMSLPENSFAPPRITPLNDLPRLARGLDAIEPSAFVFHVSRCGSTLISQLLGLDESCVVLSEVPFFDQLLRARYQPELSAVDVALHLPAAIRIHGQRRFGNEHSLVVKLDSWHAGFHAELRALYPQTPFILLYRDPVAVIRSHRRLPGMHAVNGVIENAVFGFPPDEPSDVPPHEHLPRVLGFYYETFLTIARTDPRALLVAYQQDMVPVVEAIARFAGIGLSAAHHEKIHARAAFDAKRSAERFSAVDHGDDAGNPPHACNASYEALERFRESQTIQVKEPGACDIARSEAHDS